MHWIAPTGKDNGTATLEKRLWDSADQFRANSGLKAQEYSGPILGIIFLRFAEVRFAARRTKLEPSTPSGRGAGGEGSPRVSRRGNRVVECAAYHAEEIPTLQRQIENLRRTRDLLLPRLLSGQVELETEAA